LRRISRLPIRGDADRLRAAHIRIDSMLARIYQPAKNAMQSGRAGTKRWLLEYEPERPRTVEPLMGWTSSADMRSQIALEFDTRDEAVAFAEKHEIPYQVFDPHSPNVRAKSYTDNFRSDRKIPWTH
jgi:hypothetical protein